MIDYMIFEISAENIIKDLILILQNDSPFKLLEEDKQITNGLLNIYQTLLKDLEDGLIEI